MVAHVCFATQPEFQLSANIYLSHPGHAISYLIGDCYSGFDRSAWDASYAIDPKLFNLMLKTLL